MKRRAKKKIQNKKHGNIILWVELKYSLIRPIQCYCNFSQLLLFNFFMATNELSIVRLCWFKVNARKKNKHLNDVILKVNFFILHQNEKRKKTFKITCVVTTNTRISSPDPPTGLQKKKKRFRKHIYGDFSYFLLHSQGV